MHEAMQMYSPVIPLLQHFPKYTCNYNYHVYTGNNIYMNNKKKYIVCCVLVASSSDLPLCLACVNVMHENRKAEKVGEDPKSRTCAL